MKIKSITLSNFKSFKGEHSFCLPEEPGLYLMTGDNRKEPRLEANGAGKSSIWDALIWLIYGKTSRGLKGGEVAPWGTKSKVSVEVEYECDGLGYHLKRTWNPISLVLSCDDGSQEDLVMDETNKFMGHLSKSGKLLDFTSFLNAIYFAQSSPMFLDLPPTAKASLFSEVLSLDSWVQLSDQSAIRAQGVERELATVRQTIEGDQARLRALVETDLTQELKNWESWNRAEVVAIEKRYEDVRLSRINLGTTLTTLKEDLKDLQSRLVSMDTERKVVEKALEMAFSNKDKAETKYRNALATVKVKVSQYQKFKEVGKVCGTCGGAVSLFRRTKTLASNLSERVESEAELDVAKKNFASLDEEYETALGCLNKIKETMASFQRDRVVGTQNLIRATERELELAERDLDNLEDKVMSLAERKNPFQEKQSQIDLERSKSVQTIESLNIAASGLESALAGFSYWVKGFKDVRLTQIQEALVQLEIEVNSALVQLGLVGWELKFDVSRETKSKTISKGFSVSVLSPENKTPVPWESWSGGESQRLRLATSLGLSNLIRTATGCTLPFEIWDEPTTWMSSGGVEDLLESLAERAKHEGRQIWIIDHRTQGSPVFSGTVLISKSSRGSKISAVYNTTEGE